MKSRIPRRPIRSGPGLLSWAGLVLAVVLVGPAAGQDVSLKQAAEGFAQALASGDRSEIAANLRSDDVLLAVMGQEHGSLKRRRAGSALADFLDAHESRGVSVTRVSDVGGRPPQGFAEIVWTAARPETSEVLRFTVFAGFVQEDGGWQVSDVRILR